MERFDNTFGYILHTTIFNDRLKSYERYIRYAMGDGYSVVPMIDFYHDRESADRHFVLRHDVDHNTPATRKMFETEKRMGVRSTYYFRKKTMDFELVKEMEAAGFEVGFHFETISDYMMENNLKSVEDEDLEKCKEILKNDIEDQKQRYNLRSISGHGAPLNTLIGISNNYLTEDCDYSFYGIEFEAYDREMYEHVDSHIMDNNIRHGCGFSYSDNPIDSINEKKQNIIFLSHPNHWYNTLGGRVYNLMALSVGKYELNPTAEFIRLES